MKKLVSLLLIFIMIIQLSGCTADPETVQKNFDIFIENLPSRLMSSTDISMNWLFVDETKFGFEKQLLQLPYVTEEDYNQSIKETTNLLKDLKRFNYNALTEEQQLNYDVLKDYLERSLLTQDYYLDTNYLGSFLGFQAQLPLILDEFHFNDKEDVASYFNILKTAKDTFVKYAQHEQARQDKGVGMSKAIIEKVIEQCNNFAERDNSFLIDDFNKQIASANFLTENEKISYQQQNEQLIKNDFIQAYITLGEELSKLTVKTGDLGLATLPNGKEYYAALLKQQTGIDASVDEVRRYFENKLNEKIEQLFSLYQENPELGNLDLSTLKYSDFRSAEENIEYLYDCLTRDYPAISSLNYKIKIVPHAMADNFSPAAFLNTPIDKDPSEPEIIYINGAYDQSIFPTLAHEGYPGHMYQTVYFKSLNLPAFRYILQITGYCEGWATYVENNCWKYATVADKTALEFAQVNAEIGMCITALLDIGVHYDGMTLDEFANVYYENYGTNIAKEDIEEMFALILETPTNYMQYYLTGMYLQDLHDSTQETLGNLFDNVAFHEAVLKAGPTSFNIVKQQVEKYIETAKNNFN